MKQKFYVILTTATALGLLSCLGSETTPKKHMSDILSPTGNQLGTVTLTDLGPAGTQVFVQVSGISQGMHAMHFHEVGKCDAPGFKSSGGHYNPALTSHGQNTANGPHAGDMMNINVGVDQSGEFKVVNPRVSINDDSSLPSLFDSDGSALVLHEKADDYESQPSGAAGARIGCAVIIRE